MNPFYRIGLQVIRGCEGQPDACLPESLLHHLGLEISGIVHVYLQGMTKLRLQHLQGMQYLIASGIAEGNGLEPFAEDLWPSELTRSSPRISMLQTWKGAPAWMLG